MHWVTGARSMTDIYMSTGKDLKFLCSEFTSKYLPMLAW